MLIITCSDGGPEGTVFSSMADWPWISAMGHVTAKGDREETGRDINIEHRERDQESSDDFIRCFRQHSHSEIVCSHRCFLTCGRLRINVSWEPTEEAESLGVGISSVSSKASTWLRYS